MPGLPAAAANPYGGRPSKYNNLVSPRLFHTGTEAGSATGDFNNTSVAASTELRVAEMYVDCAIATTGAAVFNATTVGTDTARVLLFDVNGILIASTAGVTTANANTYQRHPWTLEFITNPLVGTAVVAPLQLQPGTYYLGEIQSGTTSTLKTVVAGNHGCALLAGVYATAGITTSLSIVPPVTFTTLTSPVISLY